MDLINALKIIKKNLKSNIVESQHFKEQCIDRNLDIIKVRELVKKNKVLGIVEQSEKTYKIWLFYEKQKDLNIILRIQSNKELRFITIFPCQSDRRKR